MTKENATGKVFDSITLERALDNAEHVMESASCEFFAMDELALFLKEHDADSLLHGMDTISIGVRRHWVTPEVASTVKMVAPGWGTMPNEWQWEFQGVPIRVTVVERNYGYLDHLDIRPHLSSVYKIPNPFDKYWATRYLVK